MLVFRAMFTQYLNITSNEWRRNIKSRGGRTEMLRYRNSVHLWECSCWVWIRVLFVT